MFKHPENSNLPAAFATEPIYRSLEGNSLQQTVLLLLRKGGLLVPPLKREEAFQIADQMHLEHFQPDTIISFEAQNPQTGRLMLILAGEANIRLRDGGQSRSQYSPVDQTERWASASEGATLGLVHAFAGISSKFMAQASTELFVASLSRETLQRIKTTQPALGVRLMEMLAMELAFVALDHERSLQAMNNVARSMQNMIDGEIGATRPAGLSDLL